MQPTTNTPVPDPTPQPLAAVTPPEAAPDAIAAAPTMSHTFQPQTIVPEEVQGVPAAGRFDMSSVYPTIAEHQTPTVVQPAIQQPAMQMQQPTVDSSGQVAPLQPVQGAAPTQFAASQQISSSPGSWPVEKINVPMKNIYVVGLVGPFATIAMFSVLYSIVILGIFQMFSGGGGSLGLAKPLMDVMSNPGFQALIIAIFLYLNIKITATYFEDLKVPTAVMTATFSVLLTFSTIILAYKFGIGRASFNIFSGFGGAYLTLLISLFSGLLWYPLSVKWGLSPVESPMKQAYPYVSGGIIVLGLGAFLWALFKSSANLL